MRSLILTIAFILCLGTATYADSKHNYVPSAGYVPDAETAIKIAVAVWVPIYGQDQISGQAPYRAELIDGVWHVKGSLPGARQRKDENGNVINVVTVGGVAEAEISKTTGQILRITHGK